MNYTFHNRMQYIKRFLHGMLLAILGVLIALMIWNIQKVEGTARVVNYAGIVRGGTQRLVKLEIAGVENPELIRYLDRIVYGLQYGDARYNLVALDDPDFQEKLAIVADYWTSLKHEINNARISGYEATNLLDMSEEYFQLTDDAVSAAEIYSQRCSSNISNIETLSVITILIIISIFLKQSLESIRISRHNRELKQKAYIDMHTGLPNKSRCEELLHNHNAITSPTCCIMFDLNNLKKVNDSLGHIAGDTMILNFAHILRSNIPEKEFLGRYGGDEFVAIVYDTSEQDVRDILQSVQAGIDHFNQFSENAHLSYAYGYAISTMYDNCTLKILLDKADDNMYINKRKMKEAQAQL